MGIAIYHKTCFCKPSHKLYPSISTYATNQPDEKQPDFSAVKIPYRINSRLNTTNM